MSTNEKTCGVPYLPFPCHRSEHASNGRRCQNPPDTAEAFARAETSPPRPPPSTNRLTPTIATSRSKIALYDTVNTLGHFFVCERWGSITYLYKSSILTSCCAQFFVFGYTYPAWVRRRAWHVRLDTIDNLFGCLSCIGLLK